MLITGIRRFKDGALVSEEAIAVTPQIEDVRGETLRRLLIVFGARDQAHLAIKVQDANIQGGSLLDKQVFGGGLSPEEQGLADYLRWAVETYFAIKFTGDAFERMRDIPADFAEDKHWPVMA